MEDMLFILRWQRAWRHIHYSPAGKGGMHAINRLKMVVINLLSAAYVLAVVGEPVNLWR